MSPHPLQKRQGIVPHVHPCVEIRGDSPSLGRSRVTGVGRTGSGGFVGAGSFYQMKRVVRLDLVGRERFFVFQDLSHGRGTRRTRTIRHPFRSSSMSRTRLNMTYLSAVDQSLAIRLDLGLFLNFLLELRSEKREGHGEGQLELRRALDVSVKSSARSSVSGLRGNCLRRGLAL